MHPVPVNSARLRAALLTRFKLARTAPSTSNGHKGPPMSIVLAPTPANEAAARRNGAGDPLISNPRCRLWTAGPWSAAVHTPGLARSAKVGITVLYGLYDMPKPHSTAVPIMAITEIILAAPPPIAARLAGGDMPRECQHTRVYGPPAANLSPRWLATDARLLKAAPLGQQTHVMRAVEHFGSFGAQTIWTEWFRLGGYIVAVGMNGGRGVRFPAALYQAARAAHDKAVAVLLKPGGAAR
jgi:hypothetical protein